MTELQLEKEITLQENQDESNMQDQPNRLGIQVFYIILDIFLINIVTIQTNKDELQRRFKQTKFYSLEKEIAALVIAGLSPNLQQYQYIWSLRTFFFQEKITLIKNLFSLKKATRVKFKRSKLMIFSIINIKYFNQQLQHIYKQSSQQETPLTPEQLQQIQQEIELQKEKDIQKLSFIKQKLKESALRYNEEFKQIESTLKIQHRLVREQFVKQQKFLIKKCIKDKSLQDRSLRFPDAKHPKYFVPASWTKNIQRPNINETLNIFSNLKYESDDIIDCENLKLIKHASETQKRNEITFMKSKSYLSQIPNLGNKWKEPTRKINPFDTFIFQDKPYNQLNNSNSILSMNNSFNKKLNIIKIQNNQPNYRYITINKNQLNESKYKDKENNWNYSKNIQENLQGYIFPNRSLLPKPKNNIQLSKSTPLLKFAKKSFDQRQ